MESGGRGWAGLSGLRAGALIALVGLQAPGTASQVPPPSITSLLQAYWDGDVQVVSRRFARGRDVDPMLPAVRTFLDSEASATWPTAASVLMLDLAAAALHMPDPSPRSAVQLLAWGRELITSKKADRDPRANIDLEKLWHLSALALLQGIGAFKEQRAYLEEIDGRLAGDVPPRLWLARGIALEQQVQGQTAERSASALDEVARYYDRAARDPSTRAEASARAASVFLRLGRHRDALRRLEVAGDTPDLAVAAWLASLRSRTLAAIGDQEEAKVHAELAAKMGAGPGTPDPWAVLARGDDRFVSEWLPRLRASLPASAAARPGATRSTSLVVLDQYAGRDYDTVVASLIKLPSLAAFSKEFQDAAPRWANDAGPEHVNRRRALVAAVALEAAHARGGIEWGHAQQLLEWACALVRSSPPPASDVERRWMLDVERRWMHAASALIEGAAAGAALELHVTHALERLRGDPALVMARAVAGELRAGPDERTARGTRTPESVPTIDYQTVANPLELTKSRLLEAAKLPEYGREAQIRLGYTALRQGKPDAALEHLAAAGPPGASPDRFLDYLMWLFRGRALDRLKRWEEAASAYQQAVTLQPGAQTAELALAAALSRAGRRVDASSLAEHALARRDAPFDPWLSYGQSDFRHWPMLIVRVRSAVQ